MLVMFGSWEEVKAQVDKELFFTAFILNLLSSTAASGIPFLHHVSFSSPLDNQYYSCTPPSGRHNNGNLSSHLFSRYFKIILISMATVLDSKPKSA